MKIGVVKESAAHEKRVALYPDDVSKLVAQELEVLVEKDAGLSAAFTNEMYESAGARIVDAKEAFGADLVCKVQAPSDEEIKLLNKGAALVSFLWALSSPELVEKLRAAEITAFGMEAIPRITRAQKMDALSSMSSIAGYKSVLLAANKLGKYMPMLITAAGTVPPSKVLILGAGVAGLQAIATARRLGAVVEAFDVRPAVKEQVESLGAKFVDVPLSEDMETKGGYAKELTEDDKKRQREKIHERASINDVIITTALIPGKPAPLLVTKEMVADMKPGSVIVDLAAEQGGNCELTKAGEDVIVNNVVISGPLNVPSMLPFHASQLYSKNISALLGHLVKEGKLNLDFEDEITQYTTITHNGELVTPLLKKEDTK